MHAIRQYEFGAPDTLRYELVDDPVVGAGYVGIAVEAAGVHLVDTMIRRGMSGGPFPLPELPMTPGREVAGVIDMVGAGVDEGWLGRRVAARPGAASGGYAERASAPVDALHEVPDSLDMRSAVAMIGTGRTAVGILDVAALAPDDVVLVMAAVGGLGNLFVQAATRVGATVVGVAGGAGKVALARRLGSTIAVDYLQRDWPQQVVDALPGGPVTVVLDGVGGELGGAAAGLLGAGGRLVRFGQASGQPTGIDDLAARGVQAVWGIGPELVQRPGGLSELQRRALAEAAIGHWAPLIQAFQLSDAPQAHAALESRATTGKVVLVP